MGGRRGGEHEAYNVKGDNGHQQLLGREIRDLHTPL